MRTALVLVPLLVFATPAVAQPVPPQMALPPELTAPGTIDRMSNAAEAVSKALLNVPVGEFRAAIKGHDPTPRDRQETLGRETGLTDRDIHAQFEAAKPMIQHGAKAMSKALPVIMRTLADLQGTIDRATANLPDPNYPRR